MSCPACRANLPKKPTYYLPITTPGGTIAMIGVTRKQFVEILFQKELALASLWQVVKFCLSSLVLRFK